MDTVYTISDEYYGDMGEPVSHYLAEVRRLTDADLNAIEKRWEWASLLALKVHRQEQP